MVIYQVYAKPYVCRGQEIGNEWPTLDKIISFKERNLTVLFLE